MDLSRARVRYLSAIGAMLPALSAACSKEPTSTPVATADASPMTIGSSSSSSAPANVDPTPQPVAPPVASPPVVGTPRPPFHMPSCPNGAFCTTEGAQTDPKTAAPAPFTKCSLTAKMPNEDDSGLGRNRSVSFSPDNTTTERAKTPNACCYTWVIPCPGGRAFRDATGTPSVARIIPRSDWTAAIDALVTADLAPNERAALAEHWLGEAAFEHASIASFAQLTLDLLSVGAPPDLIAGAQRAALDEIEHARVAFALATAYGGTAPMGPAALAAMPGASRTLAAIARTTFIDACVGESVASAALAENARSASDPVLRDLLATMAADEERHAELAWRIVAWTLRSEDPEVRRVLSAAQADLIDELVSITGEVTTLRGNEVRASVLREVVLPCSLALLSSGDGSQRDLTAPLYS